MDYMDAVQNFQHLGLTAVTILLAGLVFVAVKWPLGTHATFSQHVAVRKSSTVFYALLFSAVLPLLALFFIGWFAPAFGLSPWFRVFIALAVATQFACVLIPESGGLKTRYHRLLAGVSALCLPPALALFIVSANTTAVQKLVAAGSLLIMVAIAYLATTGKNKHGLLLQSGYFTAFFAAVLFASYSV